MPEIPPNEEIVASCMKSSRMSIGNCPHVVRVSPHIAVKFGNGITRQEAECLKIARKLIDTKVAKVPELYRFFEDGGKGYIVMELLSGRPLTQEEDSNVIQKVVRLIQTLRSIKGKPGPLGGGISKGLLWDSDRPSFQGQKGLMENWINSRLFDHQPRINLDCEFTLCHLDLTPRNMLLLDDGSLGVVDWDFAGFYPPSFEIGSLELMQTDYKFYKKFKDLLEPLTKDEESQVLSLLQAVYNADAYYFKPTAISNRSHVSTYIPPDTPERRSSKIVLGR